MLPCVLSTALAADVSMPPSALAPDIAPLQFNASMFHAESFSGTLFANRDIFVVTGSVDALAGGTASVTTPNATKISPTITFSEQYKIEPMVTQWEVNLTMEVGGVAATGRAILEPTNPSATAPAQGWRVMEVVWQDGHDMAEWVNGPNPPPRPSLK